MRQLTGYNINILLSLLLAISFSTGCKKLVDVTPPGARIAAGNVYNSDATAIAVLNGIYTKLSGTIYTATASIPNISMWAGLSADEFSLWRGTTSQSQVLYYENKLAGDISGGEFWNNIYPLIYSCNAAIEGINRSTSLTPIVKQQLLGEAKFMRAFFYFYLVNLYGDVPLVISTDYTVNALLSRSSVTDVYQLILTDLKDSQDFLTDGFVKADGFSLYPSTSPERVRPSKAAAISLLARACLYTGDWTNAEANSTAIINNNTMFDTVALNDVFKKNSKEAIWQLQPVLTGTINNTAEAYTFVLSRAPAGVNSNHPVYLNSSLINSFEIGDKRKTLGNWVNVYSDATGTYYYPFKFKNFTAGTGVIPTEYIMILRLGEQYLIRAEARAQQNNIDGALSDLNIIRKRAGLSHSTANDKVSLLTAISHERRVELFTELGHRWMDLKRTGNVDIVMAKETPLKGGIWSSHQQLYPLPISDLLMNPNLIQNPGY